MEKPIKTVNVQFEQTLRFARDTFNLHVDECNMWEARQAITVFGLLKFKYEQRLKALQNRANEVKE